MLDLLQWDWNRVYILDKPSLIRIMFAFIISNELTLGLGLMIQYIFNILEIYWVYKLHNINRGYSSSVS